MNYINVDVLIDEVERRPGLYQRDLEEYSDRNFRRKLWDEVCAQLFDNWNELNADEKTSAADAVLKKWRNLRTCFTRELKERRENKNSKRKKYLYYDRLLFLVPNLEERDTLGVKYEHSEDESIEHVFVDVIDANESERRYTRSKKSRWCNKSHDEYAPAEESSTSHLQVLSSKEELDAETHFALSIIPNLRKLNDEYKLDAQIQILSVLKTLTKQQRLTSTQPN